MVIAPKGHSFVQRVQPMQPAWQASITGLPFSGELHATVTVLFLTGSSAMSCLGQVTTQLPQPTHFSSSTTGSPFTIVIALYGHAFFTASIAKTAIGACLRSAALHLCRNLTVLNSCIGVVRLSLVAVT